MSDSWHLGPDWRDLHRGGCGSMEGYLEVCGPVSTGAFLGPVNAPRLLPLAWVHLPSALGRFFRIVTPTRFLSPDGEIHLPDSRGRCGPTPIYEGASSALGRN